ncbi:MAG TPA: quinone oxidoreductase, partial [Micromonosporaceae bacterium]|nr:quinone oxidoreductase [Micromonosporaceae bacterium]
MVRAVQVERYGGPEVLTLAALPDPEPGRDEVVVQVAAAGVNFVETYQRSGRSPRPLPFVPGGEGAGTVVAIGSAVTGVAVGDRVASVDLAGSYAERALTRADRVAPLPPAIDTETAAAVMLQGMTAHYLLTDCYPVHNGDTILVHAAAGGMGLLLTQLATRMAARVIGTVSTEVKERLAREVGAAEIIRYDRTDVAEAVRDLTDGAGVAAVYDGVGQATFDASLASLRPRGTMVLYGAASGPVPPFDPQRLEQRGSLMLTRPSLRHFIASPEELRGRARDVLRWVADGSLSIRIHRRYPLEQARAAHKALEGRATTGKLLLIP